MLKIEEIKPHKKAVLVLVLVPLALTFIKYFGDFTFLKSFLDGVGMESTKLSIIKWANAPEGDPELRRLTYWVIVLDLFYLVLPVVLIKLILKEKLSSFGLNFQLEKGWWKIYLLFMCVMFPLVYFFSGTLSFQARYPFYDIPKTTPMWPRFWIWEAMYFTQFFCLEFFFRGFMVHGLKNAMGIWSIFVMTIPYCMIHFGKPMPETISAIIAGLVLGYISYRNGSILLGFFCHISVAVSMDLMSLWREGYFT
jgi:uncharacterized protein